MEEILKRASGVSERSLKLGQVGAWLSLLCIVHCILEPVVLPMLPMVGIVLPINKAVETGLIEGSVALAFWNLGVGFRKHGTFGPALLLCLAIFVFLMDHVGWGFWALASGPWHSLPTALGAITLAISQFWNRRMLRSLPCNHDGCSHSHGHG